MQAGSTCLVGIAGAFRCTCRRCRDGASCMMRPAPFRLQPDTHVGNQDHRGRYHHWLRLAHAHARVGSEAGDLLQDALLIAWQRSIFPLQSTDHDAWFSGVLRRQAAFQARGAVRARRREQITAARIDDVDVACTLDAWGPDRLPLATLAPAQRSVLLLALHGLDRPEICQLLDISDGTLRQRLTALRRSVSGSAWSDLVEPFQRWLASCGATDTGLARAALARGAARVAGFRLGLSDPDGHVLGISAPRKADT